MIAPVPVYCFSIIFIGAKRLQSLCEQAFNSTMDVMNNAYICDIIRQLRNCMKIENVKAIIYLSTKDSAHILLNCSGASVMKRNK